MIRLLFFCALAMLFLIGMLWVWPPVADATGTPHAVFESMDHSRTGLAASGWWWLGGLAWGSLVIGSLAAALLLATRRRGRYTPLTRLAGLVMALYWSCFLLLMVAWRMEWWQHVMGFPLPTALMLYGLWGIPLLLTWAHYRYYDRWVLPPEQQLRFRKLVDAASQHKGKGGA